MSVSMANKALDLVEELRLRRWVRLNYHRMQQDNFEICDLHPVMQDEFNRIIAESRHTAEISVPNGPDTMDDTGSLHRIDAAHPKDETIQPHFNVSVLATMEVYI